MSKQENLWDDDSLERVVDAPSSLREARNYLDDFHSNVEVYEEEDQRKYEMGKTAEAEFEKSLFYGLNAATLIEDQVRRYVDEMVQTSGTPDEVKKELRGHPNEYREMAERHLEKATKEFKAMTHIYDDLADEESNSDLLDAAALYDRLLGYAEDEAKAGKDIDMMVDMEVNRRII